MVLNVYMVDDALHMMCCRQRIDELQALWQQLIDQSDRKGFILFVCLSVCLFVCLLATLLKKFLTDFDEIFRIAQQ